VRLDTGVAPALKKRRLTGTGSIVLDFTAASALTCSTIAVPTAGWCAARPSWAVRGRPRRRLLRLRASLRRSQRALRHGAQGHRFRRGSLTGRYDCTASDWHAHWTTSTEEYCWNDYLRVLGNINSATRVVDPKTVATAWGR
jgi:hypothetical protein